MSTHSREALESALKHLKELDAVDLVAEFRAFEHSCTHGSYCALVLDPVSGKTRTVNEASWCCSANEYFRESGVLSDITLLSDTRGHWSPGPDDGFEPDYNEGENDYAHPEGDYSGWIAKDSFAEKAEDLIAEKLGIDTVSAEIQIGDPEYVLAALGWEFFSVGNTPVNGWVPDGRGDWTVKEVQKQIDELIEKIEAEIVNFENSEN